MNLGHFPYFTYSIKKKVTEFDIGIYSRKSPQAMWIIN